MGYGSAVRPMVCDCLLFVWGGTLVLSGGILGQERTRGLRGVGRIRQKAWIWGVGMRGMPNVIGVGRLVRRGEGEGIMRVEGSASARELGLLGLRGSGGCIGRIRRLFGRMGQAMRVILDGSTKRDGVNRNVPPIYRILGTRSP